MHIIMTEQDLIDGVCLYGADKYDVNPEEVNVEIFYEDDEVSQIEMETYRGMDYLGRGELLEAIEMFLFTYYRISLPTGYAVNTYVDVKEEELRAAVYLN